VIYNLNFDIIIDCFQENMKKENEDGLYTSRNPKVKKDEKEYFFVLYSFENGYEYKTKNKKKYSII